MSTIISLPSQALLKGIGSDYDAARIRPDKMISVDQNLDTNSRKMSVVNLEAALSCWKSIKNKKLADVSQKYRSSLSSKLRLSSSSIGGLPSNLMNHWLSS
jgi:hypothetical protein